MVDHDKHPEILVSKSNENAWEGYESIVNQIVKAKSNLDKKKVILIVDCYPGVKIDEIVNNLILPMNPTYTVDLDNLYYSSKKITEMIKYNLTDDRVFGILSAHSLNDFFDVTVLKKARSTISSIDSGLIIIYGVGASLVCKPDILIYADLARWEIQARYNAQMANWKADNHDEDPIRKIKRGYFFEWPVADKHKKELFEDIDFLLDTNDGASPKMINKTNYLLGLKQTVSRPFRLVPYFAAGVWGGQWMKEKFGLDPSVENYAWSFNGVPAENSIYLRYGDVRVEIPANNVVFQHPEQLLGNKVYGRFGRNFPIRFNFLDTVEGQNLSLQVHPPVEYVQETFGAHYTQDESYYVLDAKEDSVVYLGVKNNINKDEMIKDLNQANEGLCEFNDERYVNQYTAKKHDHYLIPGGTIHSQGKNSVVLEISSTPNIYTFKLWDWGRVGLDGLPRPVHLEHGINSLQWNRDENWVNKNLINRFEKVAEGQGWMEEKTGLHETQFIETRRHWFSEKVYHQTDDSVNVLILVEGEEAIVESIDNEFDPFLIHYAETFIIPEQIKEYTIRPYGVSEGKTLATMKAFVRV